MRGRMQDFVWAINQNCVVRYGCLDGSVAQRLEQRTHNPLVQGSNPCGARILGACGRLGVLVEGCGWGLWLSFLGLLLEAALFFEGSLKHFEAGVGFAFDAFELGDGFFEVVVCLDDGDEVVDRPVEGEG